MMFILGLSGVLFGNSLQILKIKPRREGFKWKMVETVFFGSWPLKIDAL